MKKYLFTGAIVVTLAGALLFINTLQTVFAETNSNRANTEKTFVISETEMQSSEITTVKTESTQGSIQYNKVIATNSNGNQLITESWYDTNTTNRRIDTRIIFKEATSLTPSNSDKEKGNGESNLYNSIYLIDHCKKIIQIIRNLDGTPNSGTITEYSDRVAEYNDSLNSKSNKENGNFDAIKAYYVGSEWKLEGTEKSADGKTLKKLSKTNKYLESKELKKKETLTNYKNNFKYSNSIEYAFIDETTGLPVKTEIYVEIDGKMILQTTSTYEYSFMKDADGSIFNTSSVKLEVQPIVDFDPEKGVGWSS